jgi:hypothetical protein
MNGLTVVSDVRTEATIAMVFFNCWRPRRLAACMSLLPHNACHLQNSSTSHIRPNRVLPFDGKILHSLKQSS